ncbi:MAG: hypothetical protein EOS58_25455 [Mesorhizobium sp.]|nr:MAG: hypothetical protein EOS58_25455 [Mesorhizobium sp.]
MRTWLAFFISAGILLVAAVTWTFVAWWRAKRQIAFNEAYKRGFFSFVALLLKIFIACVIGIILLDIVFYVGTALIDR